MSGYAQLLPSDPQVLGSGRYRVDEVLGRGGAASVYKVWDTNLEVHRAVKVLNRELSGDPERRLRFLKEARIVARLSHPHIVTVHDVGREGELLYIVMELVEGGSLAGLVGRRPPLDQVCTLMLQVLDALEHAHRAGVIHLDIKPANILLATKARALLSDFGIARMGGVERRLPGQDRVAGTWSYMPPEQVETGGMIDKRADIYAIGATLFALLKGRNPEGLYRQEDHARRLEGLSPGFVEVIRKSTAFAPDERYPTVRDMAQALRAAAKVAGADVSEAIAIAYDRDEAELAAEAERTRRRTEDALSAPGSVTFNFGTDSRPVVPGEEDSDIIPDKIYRAVHTETTGHSPPQRRATDGSQGPEEADEHIHVRPRPILKEPLKAPERGRGTLGPVRAGPMETPRKIWSVEKRTSVLQSPTHWGGADEPPPEEPEGEIALPEGSQKVVLWVAAAALLTGLVLAVLVMQPDRVDDLLATLDVPVDDLGLVAEGESARSGPSLRPPEPSPGLEADADELVIEVVGTGGGFRDAVAECASSAPVIRRLVRGVGRLPDLKPGVPCKLGLRGANLAYAPDGPYTPGTVVACRYAGRGVVCTSRP